MSMIFRGKVCDGAAEDDATEDDTDFVVEWQRDLSSGVLEAEEDGSLWMVAGCVVKALALC
jgi:hypothetical protein